MSEARRSHAAAHHQHLGFLITGGEGGDSGGIMSSTEITKDGGVTFEAFTPLPIGFHKHCVVALDGGHSGDFFVGGGWNIREDGVRDADSRRAFIYKGNQWVEIEQLPTGRNGKKMLNFGKQNYMK